MVGKVAGIGRGPIDERRLAPAHERQTHDVHAPRGHDAAGVAHAALAVEHGHVQPGVIGPEAGRPDDRLDAAVAEIEAEARGPIEPCRLEAVGRAEACLLYTSDAADE